MLRDNAYLADILQSARIIREHLAGFSPEQFMADIRTQDAVVRRFEIIGEAARHLSPEVLKALPDVPWRLVVGMRNVLIHDYDDVEPIRVWKAAQDDIPVMIQRVEAYLADHPPEAGPKE